MNHVVHTDDIMDTNYKHVMKDRCHLGDLAVDGNVILFSVLERCGLSMLDQKTISFL